jgi:delta(3,5)-delta(2,4)-dienoyl-CoA isomerase
MDPSTFRPHKIDANFQFLSIQVPETSPCVVFVSLNRPEKRNAISAAMWKEIGSAFSQLGRLGDDCRCVVLRGEGKAFTAGLDISDSSILMNGSEGIDPARRGLSFLPKILEMQASLTAIEDCPLPVIAALHGSCIGAGVDLITCCDIRLAQVGTTFSVREVQLGLAADVGTLQRLPKITGCDSRIRELCYTGEIFDHQEALRLGLVSRVCEDVLQDSLNLASRIACNSPVAVIGTKRSLLYSRDHTVQEGLNHIATHNALALMTDDIPAAFMAASKKDQVQFNPLPPNSRL